MSAEPDVCEYKYTGKESWNHVVSGEGTTQVKKGAKVSCSPSVAAKVRRAFGEGCMELVAEKIKTKRPPKT